MENNFKNHFEKSKSFFEKLNKKKKTILCITLFSAVSHIGLIWARNETNKAAGAEAQVEAEKANKEDSGELASTPNNSNKMVEMVKLLDEERKIFQKKLKVYKFDNNETNKADGAEAQVEAEKANKEVKEMLDAMRNATSNEDDKTEKADGAEAQVEAEKANKEVKEMLDAMRNATSNEDDKTEKADEVEAEKANKEVEEYY